MFSLIPTNTFELIDKKKRLIYLWVIPFIVLLSALFANEFQEDGNSRYAILIFSGGVFFLFFSILLFVPRSLRVIELLTYGMGALMLIAFVQITVYDVVTTSSDPRLLSDATNGFSMWAIVMLGVAYFALSPKQIMTLIRFVTFSMLVMAIVNFFFISPSGIKTIPYVFRWLNSAGAFIVLAIIFRWIGARQKKQAFTDSLTGLFNRFALNQILDQEMERSARSQKTFSVVLFDLDHFKKINDRYGHLEGDVVLVEMSKLIRENIRKIDFAGRWGGEEFLLVMPETDKASASIIAERLRENISENHFGKVDKVTASFGVTAYKIEDGLDKTLKRVDNALYEAKDNNRNTVIVV